MKTKYLFMALLTLGLSAGPACARPEAPPAPAFFQSMGDIPRMPGLDEIQNDDVVFDEPSGRIAEATASTAQSRAAVLSFYDSALPQLGWDKTGAGTFARDGETLEIAVADSHGRRLVRITILPGS